MLCHGGGVKRDHSRWVTKADAVHEREFCRRLAIAFSPFVNELRGYKSAAER